MHILALNTDIDGIKRRFLSAGEQEVLTAYRHGFFFFLSIFLQLIITVGILAAGFALTSWEVFPISPGTTTSILFMLWLILAFPTILKTFLDWKFDFIFVTTDKVVLMDQ